MRRFTQGLELTAGFMCSYSILTAKTSYQCKYVTSRVTQVHYDGYSPRCAKRNLKEKRLDQPRSASWVLIQGSSQSLLSLHQNRVQFVLQPPNFLAHLRNRFTFMRQAKISISIERILGEDNRDAAGAVK